MDGISEVDARALLREHDRLIRFTIRRYFTSYIHNARMPGADALLDENDLHSVGQIALIRAWLSWVPLRGKWSTHATTCIRRAIARSLGLERSVPNYLVTTDPRMLAEPLFDTETAVAGKHCKDVLAGVLAMAEVSDPDDALERQEKLRWLQEAISDPDILTPRQQQVVRAMLRCDTAREAALHIGDLTRQGVDMQYNEAIRKLRDFLEWGRLPPETAER